MSRSRRGSHQAQSPSVGLALYRARAAHLWGPIITRQDYTITRQDQTTFQKTHRTFESAPPRGPLVEGRPARSSHRPRGRCRAADETLQRLQADLPRGRVGRGQVGALAVGTGPVLGRIDIELVPPHLSRRLGRGLGARAATVAL